MEEKVLSPIDVKEHLGIGKNAAYNLFANDMSFPSFRVGKKHLILESQYVKWLEGQGNRVKYTTYDKRPKKK